MFSSQNPHILKVRHHDRIITSSCSGRATMNRCGLHFHVHVTEFALQNKKLELQFTSNEGALEKPLRTL